MKVGISEESFIKEFSESLKNGNASFLSAPEYRERRNMLAGKMFYGSVLSI